MGVQYMMKRIVRTTQSIYGMAFPRSDALFKMKSYSNKINEHTIECVVYKQIKYLTVNHWVNELSAWMGRVNKIKCDSRLKARDYVQNVFGSFGSDILDAEVNLDEYRIRNLDKPEDKQYPDFEISNDLILQLYNAYQSVIRTSLPLLMSKEIYSVDEWKTNLLPIFQ